VDWIRKNKLATILVIILLYFLFRDYFPVFSLKSATREEAVVAPAVGESISVGKLGTADFGISPLREAPPVAQEERLVIEESSLSLVVADVRGVADKIVDKANEVGGFMVSTSLTRPEEAPFATVVVRVPADKFRETIDYFRDLAIKVSSENILGTDVTAEYVDLEARLETLGKTKAKFEEILAKATAIQDILQVEQQLVNLQDQIDSLKGRQKYLEQTAKLAKITAYLSTDEYALPYVPAKPFRPGVIFKLAVRSLVNNLRSLATAVIWVGVYAVIWLPVLLVLIFVSKWWQKKKLRK
jgi:hypothetical protein